MGHQLLYRGDISDNLLHVDEDELHLGVGENLTLLHELVRQAPKEGLTNELDNDNYRAWKRLVDAASGSAVWSMWTFHPNCLTCFGT